MGPPSSIHGGVELLKASGAAGGTIRYGSYVTNYGGPLRKGKLIKAGNNMQLFATVLVDVRYRLHAVVEVAKRVGHNPRHHLQELFLRRLERGQWFQTPALGWREFTCSYWGPVREDTEVDEAVNLTIPSMLIGLWDRPVGGAWRPRYAQEARIERGVLRYA